MAWKQRECCLISDKDRPSSFEQELKSAAPLMYRSLLDLVRIMEDTASDCGKCGPDLYSYAQKVRSDLLDELISSELAGVGIKADKQ